MIKPKVKKEYQPKFTPIKKKSKRGRPKKGAPPRFAKSEVALAITPELIIPENLKIDPKLTANLTGGQIQDVLDRLILESVTPIIENSTVFDIQVEYILSTTTRNKKRKLSALDREEAINTMCQYLCTTNTAKKVALLSRMKIERGFIYNFVVNFLKEAKDYPDIYHLYMMAKTDTELNNHDRKMQTIEKSMSVDRDKMIVVINNSKDYLAVVYEFRNGIVMNYLKHAYKQAKSFVMMKGPNFDFDDVYQNFLTAITKAVDKYDSSKGALTSYINFWVLNAQTTSNSLHGHEYGVAYSIPQIQKKALAEKNAKRSEVNFGVSLEKMVGKEGEELELGDYIQGSPGIEDELTSAEEIDNIRYLAKRADTRGVARLYLDIDEHITKKEKKKMYKHMVEELKIRPKISEAGRVIYHKVFKKKKKNKAA